MKILFFIDNLGYGGKERRLLELLKGLSGQKDLELILVMAKKHIVYKEILDLDVRIFFALRKGIKKDPSVFVKFFRIAKKINPDIIHVWGNLEAIYAIPTKLALRKPMINSQIANAYTQFPFILNHKITFPFSDLIISNSKAGLNSYKAPINKSIVIYNGFSFDRLNRIKNKTLIRERLGIKTAMVVGMVASFAARKDYATLMEVINLMEQEFENLTFLCVGDGDYKSYQEMLKPGVIDRVLFLEHQEDVASVMNLCDIGVLTTFTEGISNSLLEFMALGKPVVVSGGGGCNELVENGVTGFLLQSGDRLGVFSKLKELLEDDHKRLEFGKNAKKVVETKFSISHMTDQYFKGYMRVLEENS